jgi:hypothetical protein
MIFLLSLNGGVDCLSPTGELVDISKDIDEEIAGYHYDRMSVFPANMVTKVTCTNSLFGQLSAAPLAFTMGKMALVCLAFVATSGASKSPVHIKHPLGTRGLQTSEFNDIY